MEDGKISISAYDTAWVALVEDVNGTGSPQFPSSLEWIANNQLEDGSWGYKEIFSVHDRIISTLACVIALKSWNLHLKKCNKGRLLFALAIRYLKNNLHIKSVTNAIGKDGDHYSPKQKDGDHLH